MSEQSYLTPQYIRELVACPYCGAERGAECRTASGLRLRLPYSSRLVHYRREVAARRTAGKEQES